MHDRHRDANRANWDARVPVHLRSRMYDVDGLVADPERISGVVAFDAERLGDVRGRRLLHLQCHIGTDTLSWARLGAEVTGLDFSEAAIAAARELARRAGVDVRYLVSEVHAAPQVLPDETFHIVYASVGVLCWIPDVARWARTAAQLLAPEGRLYLRDGHPVLFALDDERDDDQLVLRYPYFETAEPLRFEASASYTDGDHVLTATTTYEWNHGLAEIVQAVLDAGLVLERLEEHREVEWQALPAMAPTGGGRFALPKDRDRVPTEFSLLARRPADAE